MGRYQRGLSPHLAPGAPDQWKVSSRASGWRAPLPLGRASRGKHAAPQEHRPYSGTERATRKALQFARPKNLLRRFAATARARPKGTANALSACDHTVMPFSEHPKPRINRSRRCGRRLHYGATLVLWLVCLPVKIPRCPCERRRAGWESFPARAAGSTVTRSLREQLEKPAGTSPHVLRKEDAVSTSFRLPD